MKKLTNLLLASTLLVSCSSRAIEPISTVPLPKQTHPLSVYSVSPSWIAFKNDGAKISIRGNGFKEGALAFVGEAPCLRTKVKSDTLIRCKLPDNPPGDHSVTVMNPDGTVAPIAFTPEQIQNLDEEDQKSDGLVYFYYVKPIVGLKS